MRAAAQPDYELEAVLTWNLHGLKARYDNLADARERLGYSAPPKWVTLRAYVRAAPAEPTEDDVFGARVLATPLAITVRVVETQVSVAVEGENPFLASGAFEAARKTIEAKAVNKVPYHLRRGADLTQPSRWTRSVVWIERHPATAALIGVGVVAITTVLAAVLS
jgi:hypothetical protein